MIDAKGWIVTSEDLFAPERTMSSLQALSLSGAYKALAAPGAGLAGGPPLPSKKAKLLEARIETEAVKRKAANNCAAAARLACDRDMINGIRLIALGGRADHMAFCYILTNLKGPESTMAYFCEMSQWTFMQMLKDTVKSRNDTLELGRAGLTVRFSKNIASSLKVSSPQVQYEDCIVVFVWQLNVYLCFFTKAMSECESTYVISPSAVSNL